MMAGSRRRVKSLGKIVPVVAGLAEVLSFRADSVAAGQDTTRRLADSPDLRATIGDSMAVFQRRIIQSRQIADSLDRALGQERAAKVEVEGRVDSLAALLEGAVRDSASDGRSATFSIREPPYRVTAQVTLPPPPGDGRMTVRVAVDSAVFHARIGSEVQRRVNTDAATCRSCTSC